MKQTSNVEPGTPNIEFQTPPSAFGVRHSVFGVRAFPSVSWRILDLMIAAVFIYAGMLKIVDPVGFARDIDNYKLVPWSVAVGCGFFLPWLELFSGLALIVRFLYAGALWVLAVLTVVFTCATVVAKARALDITCGCFGHVSKGWSFGGHMVLDLALLAALLILIVVETKRSAFPLKRSTLE